MDVYLVPLGTDRYELYCETPAQTPDESDAGGSSVRDRVSAMFKRAVAEGEEQRDGSDPPRAQSRIRRAITRKLADAVAEQRLLWHLRGQDRAGLIHPDDLATPAAIEISRRLLSADRDKHRRWWLIDGALTIASAPFALLPGPNVLAYYFIFRTVGHYLSMKGAVQGIAAVDWQATPSPHLSALRHVLPMSPSSRASQLDRISEALGLDRLGIFIERVCDRAS